MFTLEFPAKVRPSAFVTNRGDVQKHWVVGNTIMFCLGFTVTYVQAERNTSMIGQRWGYTFTLYKTLRSNA